MNRAAGKRPVAPVAPPRVLAERLVDNRRGPAQSAGMCKVLALGLLSFLAACSGDPRSFGITGPGAGPPPVAPPVASPDTAPAPAVSMTGPTYGPSIA